MHETPIKQLDAHVGGLEPDLDQMDVDLVVVGQLKNHSFEFQDSIELLSCSLLTFLLDIGVDDFNPAYRKLFHLSILPKTYLRY